MSPKWLRMGASAFSRRVTASHAMRSTRNIVAQQAMLSVAWVFGPLQPPKSALARSAGGLSFQRTPAITLSVSLTPAIS